MSATPPIIPAIAPVDSVDLVVSLEFVSDESPPGVARLTPEESEVVVSDEPALVVVAGAGGGCSPRGTGCCAMNWNQLFRFTLH